MTSRTRHRVGWSTVHVFTSALTLIFAVRLLHAGAGFQLTWTTLDAGGQTPAAGGGFELNATIAQADAGTMSGDGWEWTGGFWTAPLACVRAADMNLDGALDGLDIQGFIDCVVAGDGNCDCAQLDGAAGLDLGDVFSFVGELVSDAP